MKKIIVIMISFLILISGCITQNNEYKSAGIEYPITRYPWDIQCGDINNDGKEDVITTDTLLINMGNRNFSSPIPLDTPYRIFLYDINNDNFRDIVSYPSFPHKNETFISILFNNKNDTFSPTYIYETIGYLDIFVSDLNKDNYGDIITANEDIKTISIFFNKGNGTFFNPINYSMEWIPISVFAEDFNNDGYIDITTLNWEDRTITKEEGRIIVYDRATVSIFFNKGNGSFENPIYYDVLDGSRNIFASDFNNDSYIDIVISGKGVQVLLNNNGNFSKGKFLDIYSSSLFVADVDNDKDNDIIISYLPAITVTIIFNDGKGGFELTKKYKVGHEPRAIFSADMDNDGNIDIVSANGESTITILYNDGKGDFGEEYKEIEPYNFGLFLLIIGGFLIAIPISIILIKGLRKK